MKWYFLLVGVLGVAIPIGLTMIAGAIASSYNCRLDEGGIYPCVIAGHDYGHILATMGIMGWFAVAGVALFFWSAIAYAAVVVVVAIFRKVAS